jgi:O-antigen/teichoic acid export membrane protein
MKFLAILANVVSIVFVAIAIFQGIPTLVSSNDWTQFGIGVGLILLGVAFIWTRGVELYKDFKNENNH